MHLETKRFASLLPFALMLGACGPTEEQASVTQEPSTQSESSIINGTNDSADPAVVAIFAKIKGEDKGCVSGLRNRIIHCHHRLEHDRRGR